MERSKVWTVSYADDIVLMANNLVAFREMISREKHRKSVKLHLGKVQNFARIKDPRPKSFRFSRWQPFFYFNF